MITIQHRDGTRREIPSLTAADAALIPLAQGWAFGTIEPVPTFKPLVAARVDKAPRDKATQDAATATVRRIIEGNTAVFTAKSMVGSGANGVTGPQFSAAKKALIKAGVATDPGKGKIAGKVAADKAGQQ